MPETRPVLFRYNYLYSVKELKPWVGRIREVSERTKTTYVVTNNHYEGKAVVSALQLEAFLKMNTYLRRVPGKGF